MTKVSDGRLEVIASYFGGHCVGAPATREEERAMATELLFLRALAAHLPAFHARAERAEAAFDALKGKP